jgi:hypothetical protein
MQRQPISGRSVTKPQPQPADPAIVLLIAIVDRARRDIKRKGAIAEDDRREAHHFLEWCQRELCD